MAAVVEVGHGLPSSTGHVVAIAEVHLPVGIHFSLSVGGVDHPMDVDHVAEDWLRRNLACLLLLEHEVSIVREGS